MGLKMGMPTIVGVEVYLGQKMVMPTLVGVWSKSQFMSLDIFQLIGEIDGFFS